MTILDGTIYYHRSMSEAYEVVVKFGSHSIVSILLFLFFYIKKKYSAGKKEKFEFIK